MNRLLIVVFILLLLFSLAGCGGPIEDPHPTKTPIPRMVCAQTGSGGVRCFKLPDYPKLTRKP